MKCPKCKAKADEKDEYCNKCGSPLKEKDDEKTIAIWAGVICFILILIILVGIIPSLLKSDTKSSFESIFESNSNEKDYFIEVGNCEEIDIKSEYDAEMFDMSKDLVKKDLCVDKCSEVGKTYSDYGCRNDDVFVCYCKGETPEKKKGMTEMEDSNLLLKS